MGNVPDSLYRYYQSDANFKSQNVRAILRDTIKIKARYARRLRFGIGDYCGWPPRRWPAYCLLACWSAPSMRSAAGDLPNSQPNY